MYEFRTAGLRGFLCGLLWLVAAVPLTANASFAPTPATTKYYPLGWSASHYHKDTKAAACAYLLADRAAANPAWTLARVGTGDDPCRYTLTGSGGTPVNNYSYVMVAVTPSCPANSTLSGGACVCTPPNVQNEDGNACIGLDPMIQICKDNALIENSTFSSTAEEQWASGIITGGNHCADQFEGAPAGRGCQVSIEVTGAAREGAGKPWRSSYVQRFTGSACTVGGTAPDSSPVATPTTDNPCPAGKMPGTATMGGSTVTLCTSPIDVKSEPKRETKKDNVGKPNESTEEKESQTECTGSTCKTTTTTTTKDATGAVTGVTVTVDEGDKAGLCSREPKNQVCGGQSAGNCPAGSSSAGCTDLGTPEDGELPTKEVGVGNVTPDNLAGFNIGHSCPVDLSVQIWGKNYKYEFKPLCDVAPMVKPIVVFLAAMTSLFIVYGALTAKT